MALRGRGKGGGQESEVVEFLFACDRIERILSRTNSGLTADRKKMITAKKFDHYGTKRPGSRGTEALGIPTSTCFMRRDGHPRYREFAPNAPAPIAHCPRPQTRLIVWKARSGGIPPGFLRRPWTFKVALLLFFPFFFPFELNLRLLSTWAPIFVFYFAVFRGKIASKKRC